MPSIHRIYKYGSIEMGEIFHINISGEKNIYRGNDQIKNLASPFHSATRRNGTNNHNALFSHKALFLLFETGRING